MLTQDTYLAVEAGRDVPVGMEMGPFGYFPALDDETASRMHVLNRDQMKALLRFDESPIALMSGYGLAIAAPEMVEISGEERAMLLGEMAAQYGQIDAIPDFGQGETVLNVYSRLGGVEGPVE